MPPRLAAWRRSTFAQALLGGAITWAALPPLGLSPLVWIGPLWWILLIRRPELPGRRPYTALWSAGFLFWMAALHWLRLPHWATCIGWVSLSAYLACYLPAFVGLTRIAVQRLRMPVILAAPVVWTGLELARAHLLTGFRMAAVGHTQYQWITLIQVSDLAGDYAVRLPGDLRQRLPGAHGWRWRSATGRLLAAGAGPGIAGRGTRIRISSHLRPVHSAGRSGGARPRIDRYRNSRTIRARNDFIDGQYMDLSCRAITRSPEIDLVVWPETMFRKTYFSADAHAQMPPDWADSAEEFGTALPLAQQRSLKEMARAASTLGVSTILGVDRWHFGAEIGCTASTRRCCSRPKASWRPATTRCTPWSLASTCRFSRYFPWLQRLTPVSCNLDSGEQPVAFVVGSVRYCPSNLLRSRCWPI